MHYRVPSAKVKSGRWYPTQAEAIAAFERPFEAGGCLAARVGKFERVDPA